MEQNDPRNEFLTYKLIDVFDRCQEQVSKILDRGISPNSDINLEITKQQERDTWKAFLHANEYLVTKFFHATASLLCFANILGMKGEIISCPHKDIYFLETNTKSETTDLANLFAPPPGRDMAKCKPRTKLKHKLNPALEFVVQNKTTKSALDGNKHADEGGKCGSSGSQSERTSRRNSIDLYEEAATILGLTCSQTDDCKCIECQCHYFDFEEEMDFPAGGECVMDHPSSCSIQ